jgi:hypothetical protein
MKLDAFRDDAFAAMERFAAGREAAHTALVREHLALLKQRRPVAGALALAIARLLGAPALRAEAVTLVAGFTEAAALALQALESETYGVRQRHDLPLALNSSDALLSLAHVALAGLEAPDVKTPLAPRYDRLATALWEAAGESAGEATVAGRLAGEMAAAVSGLPETAIIGVGHFAAEVAAGLAADRERALAALTGSGLQEGLRVELASLLD